MDKRAEIIHDEGIAERFVGPTTIERRFSGFRDVGGERPIGGRRVWADVGAGLYGRSTLKDVQTDKTAILQSKGHDWMLIK